MTHPHQSARAPWLFLLRSAKKQKTPSVKRRPRPPSLEALEDRTLLAAPVRLSNGILLITGGNGNDTVLVQEVSGANKSQPDQISVTFNGQTSTFKVTLVNSIQAQLGAGDDAITLDESVVPVAPPLSFDGGTGSNTVTVKGTAGADAFTITGSTVGLTGAGTLTYSNFQSLTVNGLGGSDAFSMTGVSQTTATTLDGGADTDSFTGTFAADFNGSLTLANIESATLTVNGTVTSGSSITGTSFTSVTIGTLAGTLLASGGSINGAAVTSVASTGLLKATEATGVSGSGTISGAAIGSVFGTVFAGSIVNTTIGSVANGGVVTAQGQGTTSNVSIGTLSGSFTAPEDPNAPAGTPTGVMSGTTITSITSTGKVSTGSISGMSVGAADSGSSITAAGQGTTSNVSIGTLSGSFTAPEDPKAPAGTPTGTMSNTTIGTVTSTGVVSTGSISGMSVGAADSGSSITTAGQGTASTVSIGTLSGTLTATPDATPGSGTLSDVFIGKLATTGIVSAAKAFNLTITDVGGTVDVTDLLDRLSADTLESTAKLMAGHFNIVTAVHASPVVNFVEPTVTRTLALTPHVTGAAVPDYGFYYDGTAAGDPRVVIQIAVGSTPVNFDLGATTNTTTASPTGFDLAGLFSNSSTAATGVHNVVIGGNLLLNSVPTGAISFFGLPANTAGGVHLPNDSGIGVAAAGALPAASIVAKNVAAVAAGSFAGVSADDAGHTDALNGAISGTIETTVGDLGRALTDAQGNITSVTSIQAGGGGLTSTGQILVKGNLVSQVSIHSGLDGVIAADGDIGVIQTVNGVAKTNADGSLIRFGGVTVSTGGLNGEVIALGNVFGDISVTGGLSGRIAVQGQAGEFGLASSRFGILGNVAIGGGISTTGAVVSDDRIGDSAGGTFLTISGTDKGILAAGQGINFGATGSLNQAGIFNPATGADLAAIDAIFTDGGVELDVTHRDKSGKLDQLPLIIQDLLALTVTNGHLTGTKA
jgi:hypothetical protein